MNYIKKICIFVLTLGVCVVTSPLVSFSNQVAANLKSNHMSSKIFYQKGEILGNNNIIYLNDITSYIFNNGERKRKALFLCHCNNEFESVIQSIKNNHTKSCGCLNHLPHMLINYKENEIIGDFNIKYLKDVESYISPLGEKRRKALFQCHCGNQWVAEITSIKIGHTKSCGCEKYQEGENHPSWKGGLKSHPSWKRYYNMKNRCYDNKNKSYKDYGGRGIKISKEFLDNKQVYFDYIDNLLNAYKEGYSVDRIENDRNYEKGNLRWATDIEQACNKRKVKR